MPEKSELIKQLENLRDKRKEVLNQEVYQSYNYGYVAGEVEGIKKAINLIEDSH